jgi:ribose transport system ATP-binding protein
VIASDSNADGGAAAAATAGALVVDQIWMEFNGRPALRDVSLTFEPGTVHGLVGHNGSGKSTLVRILAGYHVPTAGSCSVAGTPLDTSPGSAQRCGLRFVHQDLGLIREFDAMENFGVGGEYPSGALGTINWKEQARRMRDVYALLDCPLPKSGPVSELTAVERSLLAIARAVGANPEESGAKFIVLDEPTTALEGPEAEHLFAVVRRLKLAGIGTIFISHQLTDVLGLCSAVSVLRDGEVVGTYNTEQVTQGELVEAMLGPEAAAVEFADDQRRENSEPSPNVGESAISVIGLEASALRGLDLDVRKGECVCAVGLAGSGREQLAYAIAGSIPVAADSVKVEGVEQGSLTPAKARKLGIALAPGNRLPGSLVNDFALKENLSFASLDAVSGKFGILRRGREDAVAEEWVDKLDIKPRDVNFGSRFMSGGNKQKVVMAKWLSIKPIAMLIDEPSAGVDVGAVAKLFSTLREFVADGGSLLITTSELDDALALADRIVVLRDGKVARTFVRGTDEFSEPALLLAMVE